ncbi:hypothetical protein BVX99_03440, partial [bacterium F16]
MDKTSAPEGIQKSETRISEYDYFKFRKVEIIDSKTVPVISSSDVWPTPKEWISEFEDFLDTGVLYAFQQEWRKFHQKFPEAQLPYIELSLKTRDESGQLVDFSTSSQIQFEWISNRVFFEEAQAREVQDKIFNRYIIEKWRWNSEPFDKRNTKNVRIHAEYKKLIDSGRVKIVGPYDCPFGVKKIRLPVLSSSLDEDLPELASNLKEYDPSRLACLRSGEWYSVKLYMLFD